MAKDPMKIIYTYTDEAPALATHSLLPILKAYAGKVGVDIETRDISLAARILAAFDLAPDALGELGALAKTPDANIIKLPNISASIPQLKAAIAELQGAGYAVPDYPEAPQSDDEKKARAAYDGVKGSAVNPVLREGNSARRAPASVKNFAKKHPHSMGAWSADSRTDVATMAADDFRHNEKSVVIPRDGAVTIRLQPEGGGDAVVLRDGVAVTKDEILDATVMRAAALDAFLAEQLARAVSDEVLFSVHLKATMMKVSDPVVFGHVVRAYFADVFDSYGDELTAAGLDGSNGLGAILSGLDALDHGAEIRAAIEQRLADGPPLAMVNSDKGITNLHVPSDVI